MELGEAVKLVKDYDRQRIEARKVIIKELQRLVNTFPNIAKERLGKVEIRKIRAYTSDLRDIRLVVDLHEMQRQED